MVFLLTMFELKFHPGKSVVFMELSSNSETEWPLPLNDTTEIFGRCSTCCQASRFNESRECYDAD